jgi:diguanylate cyclase (GGDEF)-like protein
MDVATRLQNNIRTTDTAARLAGDEFVVILEDIQALSDVEQIATKIVTAIVATNEEMALEKAANVSASIGISVYPEDGVDVETLLRKADRAMYEAKTLGRNQLVFYNPIFSSQSLLSETHVSDY